MSTKIIVSLDGELVERASRGAWGRDVFRVVESSSDELTVGETLSDDDLSALSSGGYAVEIS